MLVRINRYFETVASWVQPSGVGVVWMRRKQGVLAEESKRVGLSAHFPASRTLHPVQKLAISSHRPPESAPMMRQSPLDILDFTEPFLKSLNNPQPSVLTAAWTADGRYLLINDLHVGGCVIQPDPFRCIRIADRLPSRLNEELGIRYKADIYPLPMVGWLRARDPYLVGYLVDYEGRTFIPLGELLGTWSADGTVAGVVDDDKRLRLRHIQLPPLAGSQPASAPIREGASAGSLPIERNERK